MSSFEIGKQYAVIFRRLSPNPITKQVPNFYN